MSRSSFLCVITICVGLCLSSIASSAEESAAVVYGYEKDILPLIESYCMNCHNGDDLEGDLDLERFATQDSVLDSLGLWQRAMMRLEKGEMPPGKREKPTEEEKAIVKAWIGSLELNGEDCNRIANEESQGWFPGVVMSRRLNREEYARTVRDLLGVELDLAGMFPADGAGGEGFDTVGNALYLSAIQIERYVEAADLAVEGMFSGNGVVDGGLRLAGTLALPVSNVFLTERGETRGLVRRFVERAWRRPVLDRELDRFMGLLDSAIARGDSFEEAFKLVMKAAMVSPHFIFLAEPEPGATGVYGLGDFPLASRLSYFLWGTMPDAALFAAARRGALQDDDELRYQVRRMLADPKVRGLGELFAAQWLGISQLGETIRLDEGRFPEFDDAMTASMRGEAATFFTYVVQNDRSLLELIDSDYQFVDGALASIYGLVDMASLTDFVRVPSRDRARGGVLGMSAVLASTSQPLRTSPVLRGKWVLETLLGDRVPPPPPNVEPLPEDDAPVDGLTLRARLEAHRSQEECASCHSRMDPLGFGLENFDPLGRWRDEVGGQRVDSAGTLPSGETFDGPAELKAVLMERKDRFAQHLSRKVLGYGLGRPLNRFDTCVIDDCAEALRSGHYRASVLFETVVLSFPFRHRYSGGKMIEPEY